MFQSFPKSHLDPLKMHFFAFLTNYNSKTKHFQWELKIKMAYLGGRLHGVQIPVWLLSSLVSYLTQKLGKSCLPLIQGNFCQFLAQFKEQYFLNQMTNRAEIFRRVFSSWRHHMIEVSNLRCHPWDHLVIWHGMTLNNTVKPEKKDCICENLYNSIFLLLKIQHRMAFTTSPADSHGWWCGRKLWMNKT